MSVSAWKVSALLLLEYLDFDYFGNYHCLKDLLQLNFD